MHPLFQVEIRERSDHEDRDLQEYQTREADHYHGIILANINCQARLWILARRTMITKRTLYT